MSGTMSAARRFLTEGNAATTYVPLTQKGAANGVATLGADGRLTPAQTTCRG